MLPGVRSVQQDGHVPSAISSIVPEQFLCPVAEVAEFRLTEQRCDGSASIVLPSPDDRLVENA